MLHEDLFDFAVNVREDLLFNTRFKFPITLEVKVYRTINIAAKANRTTPKMPSVFGNAEPRNIQVSLWRNSQTGIKMMPL